jgi:hypothetical protein
MQVQQGTTVINSNKDKNSNNDYNNNPLFDRKVDLVTAGLPAGYTRSFKNKVSQNNALIICNYITSMKTEINLSDNCRKSNIDRLVKISKFHNHKPFRCITRSIRSFV